MISCLICLYYAFLGRWGQVSHRLTQKKRAKVLLLFGIRKFFYKKMHFEPKKRWKRVVFGVKVLFLRALCVIVI